MEDSIFRNPTLLAFIIKKLREKYSDIQIGKTVIQKIVFLLSRELTLDFEYGMYHYGPYSNRLDHELNFAEDSDLVKTRWVEDQGYFIEATDELLKFEKLITPEEKKVITEIVENYGDFNAKELAVITTALYLKDKYGLENEALPVSVHQFKDHFTTQQIERLLKSAGII
jgi:uncharacterized protein YwgA